MRNKYSLRWKVAHHVLRFLFKILTGAKWENFQNFQMPDTPVIITANHGSYMDPPLIIALWEREIYFLAHSGLFKNPIFGGFLKFFNALPLPHGFKKAYRLISSGYDIGIFPEGGRNRFPKVEPGAFKLSKDTGCPIAILYIKENKVKVYKKVVRWILRRNFGIKFVGILYPERYVTHEDMMRDFQKRMLEVSNG